MEKNAYICRVLNREICNLKKEKTMAQSSSHAWAAFLGGAILGGIAALLLAPKSGKELRNELVDLAEREAGRCRCEDGEECNCDEEHDCGCHRRHGHGCCHHENEMEEQV